MTQSPDTSSEIKEQILDAIEGHYMDAADGLPYTARELAEKSATYRNLVKAFEAHIADTEKAYGGCHNCYGKGYATVNDRWIGHDTDQDIGSPGGTVTGGKASAMKFCTCGRGKQIKAHKLIATYEK